MFERKNEPLASTSRFVLRMLLSICVGLVIITIALCVGITGFHHFEGMEWLNAFENSAMILSTMGPVVEIKTNAGKIFSAFYALFSGLVFVTIMGIIFAPIVHRCLHKFHRKYDEPPTRRAKQR